MLDNDFWSFTHIDGVDCHSYDDTRLAFHLEITTTLSTRLFQQPHVVICTCLLRLVSLQSNAQGYEQYGNFAIYLSTTVDLYGFRDPTLPGTHED